MANAPLGKIIKFYCRFTPNFSAIGYLARRPFWRGYRADFSGRTWLVTGGSEGIGAAAGRAAVAAGARLIAAARSRDKLEAFAASTQGPGTVAIEVADFSLMAQVREFVDRMQAQSTRIDVLVNNVGIQKRDRILTSEGFETSFATNVLGHYLLTRMLLERGLLAEDAVVIEVSSGGMYNHAMVPADLNITDDRYLGVRAYGLAKRAQMMMTTHWRQTQAASARSFYAMHPGWVATAAIGRSMPRFRAILGPVLRNHAQGADTIVWLAATRPKQQATEAIWFDRKARTAHIYAHTPKSTATPTDVIAMLADCLDAAPAQAPVPESTATTASVS